MGAWQQAMHFGYPGPMSQWRLGIGAKQTDARDMVFPNKKVRKIINFYVVQNSVKKDFHDCNLQRK